MSLHGAQGNHSLQQGLFPEWRTRKGLTFLEKKHNAVSKRNYISTRRKNVSLTTRERHQLQHGRSLALQQRGSHQDKAMGFRGGFVKRNSIGPV